MFLTLYFDRKSDDELFLFTTVPSMNDNSDLKPTPIAPHTMHDTGNLT